MADIDSRWIESVINPVAASAVVPDSAPTASQRAPPVEQTASSEPQGDADDTMDANDIMPGIEPSSPAVSPTTFGASGFARTHASLSAALPGTGTSTCAKPAVSGSAAAAAAAASVPSAGPGSSPGSRPRWAALRLLPVVDGHAAAVIFHCNNHTQSECLSKQLLAAPDSPGYRKALDAIELQRTLIFLLNRATGELHGVFRAVAKGVNLQPDAFQVRGKTGRFPLQVQVRRVCEGRSPLTRADRQESLPRPELVDKRTQLGERAARHLAELIGFNADEGEPQAREFAGPLADLAIAEQPPAGAARPMSGKKRARLDAAPTSGSTASSDAVRQCVQQLQQHGMLRAEVTRHGGDAARKDLLYELLGLLFSQGRVSALSGR